jgi:hypothetical protein
MTSPHFEMPPIRSISPDCWRRGVRLRQMGPAIGHYQQALMLNPRHRSAVSFARRGEGDH